MEPKRVEPLLWFCRGFDPSEVGLWRTLDVTDIIYSDLLLKMKGLLIVMIGLF
jgi:hypothetical protein